MNQLQHETSPYLLQHKNNPVDWYPWKEEVLQKAQQENKLLIISVGYAACHWCHHGGGLYSLYVPKSFPRPCRRDHSSSRTQRPQLA